MNLKQFFQITKLSFYSPLLYITIMEKWKHWGLGFLLKFSILVSIISSIAIFLAVSSLDFSSASLRDVINQIPEIRIEKDKAFIVDDNISLPMQISYPGTNKNIVIVDLSIDDSDKYKQDVIVFTKDRIAINFIDTGGFSVSYSDFLLGTSVNVLNPDSLINILEANKKKLLGVIIFLAVPLGSLLYLVFTLLKCAFYASIAHIIVNLLKCKLDFKQLLRIAIVTNAPATLLISFLSMISFVFGFSTAIQFVIDGIYICYFTWAVVLCKNHLENQNKTHNL